MVFGRRNTSTVAPQALFLMNNPLVEAQSRLAAVRLLKEVPADDVRRIELAFRRLLGRFPSAAERATALQYVQSTGTVADLNQQSLRWGQLVQALMGSVDFRYVN